MAGKFTVGDLLALIQVDRTQFDRGVDGAEKKLKTSADKQNGILKGLQKGWDLVGDAAKKAFVGAVIGSAAAVGVQGVLQFAGALVPLLGLLVAVPGLALGAAAGLAVLKIGMSGVGDAIKGDAEAFARLSPAAQETVSVLRQMAPAWDAVRKSVQDALFDGIAEKVKQLGAVWLPVLGDSLGSVAFGFSTMGRAALDAASSSTFITQIQDALYGVGGGLEQAAGGIGPLILGFGALVQAANPILRGLGPAFAQMGQSVGDWLVQANASGQLTQILQTALDTAKTFGGVLVQIGGIVGAVFSAAQAGGGGFLETLRTVLTEVNAFLSAGEGRAALVSLFAGAQAVVKALLPILTGVLGQLGPGVTALLAGLAAGLTALLPAAVPVGQAISAIVVAIAPLLPVVGQLAAVLLTALANGLQGAAAAAGPMIGLVAQLGTSLLSTLLPPLLEFSSRALPDIIRLGLGFADAFRPLIPVVLQLASTFLSGLLPSLMQLGDMFRGEVVPQLLQLAQNAAPLVLQMLQMIIPLVPELTRSFIQTAMSAMQLVTALMPLMPLVTLLIDFLIRGAGGGLIVILAALEQQLKVASFAMQFWAAVINGLVGVIDWLVAHIGVALAAAQGFAAGVNSAMAGIPASVMSVFSGAASWLWNAGRNIVQGLVNGIESAKQWIKDKLSQITSLIPSWKGPADVDRALLVPTGKLLMSGLVAGIHAGAPMVKRALGDLTVALPRAARPPLTVVNMPPSPAPQLDARELARSLRWALESVTVILDGSAVGRIQSNEAGLLMRAG